MESGRETRPTLLVVCGLATMMGMDEFAVGEDLWVERLANLRNSVRQELIARQLGEHVHNGSRVLDVGCGQGTQAIRLAQRGCDVVGVDPSTDLLARLTADADSAGVRVSTHHGRLEDLAATVGRRRFDVVCAHGLLMYLDDPQKALATLAARVAPGGLLSVTFRNGGALAFRALHNAGCSCGLNPPASSSAWAM